MYVREDNIMYFMGYCGDLFPILKLLKILYGLLQFLIPIGLILFGAIDLGKAVMAGKEDEMKKAQSSFIKRVINAVVFFLLFTIVSLVMNVVADSTVDTGKNAEESWSSCWKCASGSKDDFDACIKTELEKEN